MQQQPLRLSKEICHSLLCVEDSFACCAAESWGPAGFEQCTSLMGSLSLQNGLKHSKSWQNNAIILDCMSNVPCEGKERYECKLDERELSSSKRRTKKKTKSLKAGKNKRIWISSRCLTSTSADFGFAGLHSVFTTSFPLPRFGSIVRVALHREPKKRFFVWKSGRREREKRKKTL